MSTARSSLAGRLRPFANALSVVVAITMSALAVALPLNGQNTGEISDRFKVYFVPSGYVFAIWGVIYLTWIAFVAYQLLPAHRDQPRFRALGWWFALSGVLNGSWLVCWHYNRFALSLVVMVALLVTLITCYIRLGVGRTQSGALERWCVDIPFGLYLGWITVATVANASDVLYDLQWGGWGITPQVWTVILLGVACLIGAGMALVLDDVAFPLVLVWAFVGIADKHLGPKGLPDAGAVISAAWVAAAVAMALALAALWKRWRTASFSNHAQV